jgi:acyl-coenzyme A synthetase/AMP-(fatty) acid ligase
LNTPATAILLPAELHHALPTMVTEVLGLVHDGAAANADESGDVRLSWNLPDLPADTVPGLILCTSGTSGFPKLVMRPAASLKAEGRFVAERLGLTADSTMLCCVPLSHAFGLGMGMLAVRQAGASLLSHYPRTARALLRVVEQHRITHVLASPAQLNGWGRGSGVVTPPGRLPMVITAGAPLPEETAEAFRATFGYYPAQQYGCSEVGAISVDDSGTCTAGHLGRPYPGVTVELAPGEHGPADARPLVVRSPSLACCYIGDAELTHTAGLSEGEFRTADVGTVTRDHVVVTGRTDRQVNIDGKKVDASSLERRIGEWDGVSEVAVVGIPDQVRGQRIVAAYVAPEELADEVLNRNAQVLPAGERPVRFVRMKRLPRTGIGKVDVEQVRREVHE